MDDSAVNRLISIAQEAGASKIVDDALSLRERLREGLFYVACVGQFKRGKSTLLNALIEKPLLPVGVPPVTAIVTQVKYGPALGARARLASSPSWQPISVDAVSSFVSEQENPGNQKGVLAVEISAPNPLLTHGMCLVDTPGISSVVSSNTEATNEFVPHIDAALVVLGIDPPVSADQLSLIKGLSRQCSNILYVLSKADRHTDSEISQAAAFTSEVLKREIGIDKPNLFVVSGTEANAGPGPTRDWNRLTEALTTLANNSSAILVKKAEERHLKILKERLEHVLREELGALQRPIAESQERMEKLRVTISEAKVSLNDLSYLLTGEQERISRLFETKKEKFLQEAIPSAKGELHRFLSFRPSANGSALRLESVKKVRELAEQILNRWLAEMQPLAEQLYIEAANRFVKMTNEFLAKIQASGGDYLQHLSAAMGAESGFRARSRLYYTFMMPLTTQTPFGWFLDLLRPKTYQLLALERQVGEYLSTLLYANANRVSNDFDDRIGESRRHFEKEVTDSFDAIITSAEESLKKAQVATENGSFAIESRVHELKRLLEQLGGEKTSGS